MQLFALPNKSPSINQTSTTLHHIKNTYALYQCSQTEWKNKIENYLRLTDGFTHIGPMTVSSFQSLTYAIESCTVQNVHHILHAKNDQIRVSLTQLYQNKEITREQYDRLMNFNEDTTSCVNQLDFVLAMSHDNAIIIEPNIIYSNNEPIKHLAHFINDLLTDLYDHAIFRSSSNFSTGYKTIRAFEQYHQQGLLKSTTSFVKMSVVDLFTTLSHSTLLNAFEQFLLQHQIQHIRGISIATIIQLVQLVLHNQYCVYENDLYEVTLGGSKRSKFIVNLIDIYLDILLKAFAEKLFEKKEIFGRNHEQIIFTWNDSTDDLYQLITETIMKDTHQRMSPQQLHVTLGNMVQYLDAEISHDKEQNLRTKVYHNLAIEPETLPYIHECLFTVTDKLLEASLRRAFLYCADVVDFEAERMFIECAFQKNHVSLSTVVRTFANILMHYDYVVPKDDTFMNMITYNSIRQRMQYDEEKKMKHSGQRRYRRCRRRQLKRL
ncbi:unnamed protein product [Adineta ricciae]|uniref:Uncharacterized protein n=1 Tax=Adineta ricciae TaxID=249248 RepID=A0A815S098_ADIRI|nr:unnamed protein product [Adineta ricciae]